MTRLALLVLALALYLSTACDSPPSPAPKKESGKAVSPFGLPTSAIEASKEMKDRAAKLGSQPPPAAMSPKALESVLSAPSGFKAVGTPVKENKPVKGEFVPVLRQKYERGKDVDRQTMKVTLMDGRQIGSAYSSFSLKRTLPRPTHAGRGAFKWKDYDAFEFFDAENGDVEFSLLVADRFLLTLEGRGVTDQTAEEFLATFALEKLATWATQRASGSPDPD